MTYSSGAYWQAAANRCKEFADEGACLARISRRVPVTIVPGFGLGQVGSELTTLAPGGTEIRAIQTALIHAGVLTLRTADGLISSGTSPTLAAIRTWATSNGLSSTGTARTSNSGLVIPTSLMNRILAVTTAPAPEPAGPDSPITPAASTVLPAFSGKMPGWVPWVIGGTVVLGMGAFLMGAGTGARITGNRRRRSH